MNYVLNPSLEQYWKCPTIYDEIKFAKYWSPISDTTYSATDSMGDPNCTPEYCNTCAALISSSTSVPNNFRFHHYPRTGQGMAQVVMFSDETFYYPYFRDYLQGRLYKPLISGKNYCVTFYVCSEDGSSYAVNHIGAYLDNGSVDTVQNCGLPHMQYTPPQIVENSVISDTLNWTKVEGSFIATGTERFITIGNFYDKAHTSYIPTGYGLGEYALYLVDDVSVIESDHVAFAGNDTSIYKGDSILLGEIAVPYTWYKDSAGLKLIDSTSGGIWVKPDTTATYVVKQTLCGLVTWDTVVVSVMPVNVVNVQNGIHDFRMYPNPNNGSFTISGTLDNSKEAVIEIFNAIGQKVYTQAVLLQDNKLDQQLNLHLPPGVYTLQIHDDNNRACIHRLLIY